MTKLILSTLLLLLIALPALADESSQVHLYNDLNGNGESDLEETASGEIPNPKDGIQEVEAPLDPEIPEIPAPTTEQ